MEFFNSAVDVLQTLVIALGAGLAIWGVINLLEGYGNDNRRRRYRPDRHRSCATTVRTVRITGGRTSCKVCFENTMHDVLFIQSYNNFL